MAIFDIISYMINHSMFNTYITHTDNDSEICIILRQSNYQKISDITKHLKKAIKITINDPIIGESCAICMDAYQPKEYKRVLEKCNHCFHKKCIDKWFKRNPKHMTCPICRASYNLIL